MLAERLDTLAEVEPQPYPVLSVYLDTAPNETGHRTFDLFVRQELTRRLDTFPAGSSERKSLEKDADRILRYLQADLRPEHKSVAIFACAEAGLFEAVPLEIRLEKNVIVVSDRPHLYPLALVDDQYPRYAAVVANTNLARIFVFSTGQREHTIDVAGQKTKRVKVGGWSQARYQRHVENFHLHHVKEVVDVLDRVVRQDRIPHVILAGDEVVVPLVQKALPKHLAEKIVDVMRLDPRTPDHDVLTRTLAQMRQKDAESDKAVAARLLDEYRGGGLAAIGAADTLAAFRQGQVDTLVLTTSPSLIEEADLAIGTAPTNTHTGSVAAGLAAVDDAAESPDRDAPEIPATEQTASELVRQARRTSAAIRFIEDPALLSEVGGVGAFLRFRR
jgi:peptide chain release factor subunit 1